MAHYVKKDKQNNKPRYDKWNLTSQAKIIGYFSVDGDRNYLPNSSRLKYYNLPYEEEVCWDLNEGIESAVCRAPEYDGEGIALTVKWIRDNYQKIKAHPASNRWIQPNFVCSRGMLVKFFIAPYSPNECWTILAAKWRGTIYLRTDKRIKPFHVDEDRNKNFGSWGFKFEQYVLSDSPEKAPDTSKPVIEAEEFRCIFSNRIGKHQVLYSTVMKGVCSKERLDDPLPLDKMKFVELKTSRIIEHGGHEKVLRTHKSLKWWSMGFLANETLLCGFRDVNGVVQKLKNWTLQDLVRMGQNWQPLECINCCAAFLTQLVDSVIDDCDKTIYEITRISHDEFNVTELSPSPEISVLPASFMEESG